MVRDSQDEAANNQTGRMSDEDWASLLKTATDFDNLELIENEPTATTEDRTPLAVH